MKKVKFRLLKDGKYWFLQLKGSFGRWKTFGRYHLASGGAIWMAEAFKSKKAALKELPFTVKTRKDLAEFIQYPTIKMLRYE